MNPLAELLGIELEDSSTRTCNNVERQNPSLPLVRTLMVQKSFVVKFVFNAEIILISLREMPYEN